MAAMAEKTYSTEGQEPPESHIGATLEALASTIAARAEAGEESYTYRLLQDPALLRAKIAEEAGEVAEASAEEGGEDHLRYEAGDLVYHLLVMLVAHGISPDELAAELNMRMREDERPEGAILLHEQFLNRGK